MWSTSRFCAYLFAAVAAIPSCYCGDNSSGLDSSAYTPETGSEGGDSSAGSPGLFATLPESSCGPREALVTRTLDGDTIEIALDAEAGTNAKVRLILVDTPEISHNSKEVAECFGPEAQAFTRGRVGDGATWIGLTYDSVCTDRYGRLLAYVHVANGDGDGDGANLAVLNEELLRGGFATVLYIPPDGKSKVDEYREIAATAKSGLVGGYGACAKFNP